MSRLSRPAWLTTGLLIGAIAVPAVAVAAAATVVNIKGSTSTIAQVTPAGQLRTAEFDPAYNFHIRADGNNLSGASFCYPVDSPSTTRAAIIKQVNFNMLFLPQTGFGDALLYSGTTCSGAIIAEAESTQTGVQAAPLGNGVAIPLNGGLSLLISDKTAVAANIYGYTVASNAIHASAAQMSRIGPSNVKIASVKH